MNCREAVELLGDDVDGRLSAIQRWRLRVHVWICRHCRNYIRSYKTTVQAGRAAFLEGSDALPAAVPESVVQSILRAAGWTAAG